MHNTAEKLPEVTVISDMPNDEYHAQPSFSSSQLKDFLNHPPAYFHAKYIAKTLQEPEKKAFVIGDALHTAWMEPEKFADQYIVAPKCDRRTKEGKLTWAKFLQLSEGKILMTEEDGQAIAAMCKQLNGCKNAMALKQGCLIEHSLFWTDEETGLPLRIRPDMWKPGRYVPDLKTTKDASINSFSRDLYNYGYHISAAMYLDGLRIYGEDITDFIYICVDNLEPYLPAIYTLSDEAIEIGHHYYRQAVRGIAHCLEADHWPGHNDDEPTEITLPQWVLNKENI